MPCKLWPFPRTKLFNSMWVQGWVTTQWFKPRESSHLTLFLSPGRLSHALTCLKFAHNCKSLSKSVLWLWTILYRMSCGYVTVIVNIAQCVLWQWINYVCLSCTESLTKVVTVKQEDGVMLFLWRCHDDHQQYPPLPSPPY